jgi:predicted GH43/DUF377 family glycosyl hydrolase
MKLTDNDKGTKAMNIISRYHSNPILKPEDMPFDCFAVYNGGAIKINDEYILMVRCEDTARRQFAWTARSRDGYSFTPDSKPVEFIAEDMDNYMKYAKDSWYDPRINVVEGKYYITYAANSKHGCRIAIGKTKDFKTVEHVSFPHHVQNRNAVLFPEKIDGMYVMLHRPDVGGNGCIWISRSLDLKFWGDSEVVAEKSSFLWDSLKIGAGPPPIKTEEGWLVLTHAVCGNCAGHFYTMGALLFDLENPYKLIGSSDGCIMRPEAEYELTGFVPNVIFPCGAILEDDGMLKIYYGAADNYECLATVLIRDILNSCKRI